MARTFYTSATYGGHPRGCELLPFRFTRLDDEELLVNEAGEYVFVPPGTVNDLVRRKLATNGTLYQQLKAKQFLWDDESSPLLDVLATKYRTKKGFLESGPTLHIVVLTQRCDNACTYCQVSRQGLMATGYDMTRETARRTAEWILQFPSRHMTVEFQGGEPLLAFPILRYTIDTAKELATTKGKDLTFVVATNLAGATKEVLSYFRDADVKISTSLDGPAFVHNANRPRPGADSHAITIENIRRARDYVGPENVSALMTTTRTSLQYPREIVDEYISQGFGSIFLRSMNPYGFAVINGASYSADEFLGFYRAALEYIISINRQGTNFSEVYASILLTKILTPAATGYVDLQSPCGAGNSVLVYHYDGDIYASDESRMLAEMQDRTFRLGNVHQDDAAALTRSAAYQYLMSASCNETLPGCTECAYQPYCGTDPVRNHASQGDAFGHRPTSNWCRKNREIIGDLFRLIRCGDPALMRILFAWIRQPAPWALEEPCV